MLHPKNVKPGDFVRQVAMGVHKGEEVMKVVIVSGSGDLVVEHPSGDLAVFKANDLRIENDEAA